MRRFITHALVVSGLAACSDQCSEPASASGGGGIQDPEPTLSSSTSTATPTSAGRGGSGGGGGAPAVSSVSGSAGGDPGDGGAGGLPGDLDGPDPLCPGNSGEGGQGGHSGPDACEIYRQKFCAIKDERGCKRNGGEHFPCPDEGTCFAEGLALLACLEGATTVERCRCAEEDGGAAGGGGAPDHGAMYCREDELCSEEESALAKCQEQALTLQ